MKKSDLRRIFATSGDQETNKCAWLNKLFLQFFVTSVLASSAACVLDKKATHIKNSYGLYNRVLKSLQASQGMFPSEEHPTQWHKHFWRIYIYELCHAASEASQAFLVVLGETLHMYIHAWCWFNPRPHIFCQFISSKSWSRCQCQLCWKIFGRKT